MCLSSYVVIWILFFGCSDDSDEVRRIRKGAVRMNYPLCIPIALVQRLSKYLIYIFVVIFAAQIIQRYFTDHLGFLEIICARDS